MKRTGTLLIAIIAALLPLQIAPAQAAPVADPPPTPGTQQVLAADDTATLDDGGRLYYVDPLPQVTEDLVEPSRSQSATTAQAGLAIPALHSRPASTHTIFLDFDGVTLGSSNAWVTSAQDPISAGTKTGFTLDANPDFDAAEIAYIQKVWKIVAEKYSPYDVDVTTVDPGVAGYTRTNSADNVYGTHVVITDDPGPVSQVCNSQCAGVAYNDSFSSNFGTTNVYNNTNYEPAWVFSSQTFGSPQVTALDAAHEIGHTLALNHDGDTTHPDYYLGHANWVPIMGITNQNAVSQFSKGEYAGANNAQDDLAVIGSKGNSGAAGSLIVADDYILSSGAPTGAAALGDQTAYDLDGIITNAADDDLFSIDRTCSTALTATATGIGAGQSVDLKVEILDNSNGVLASNNPASGQTYVGGASNAYEPTGMDAAATLPAPIAGTTYRIRVDGVGVGTASTGYTDYGSIGQYHLSITGCPAPAPNVPGAPESASATPNPHTTTGTVNWTAPTTDGGSPVTEYRITGLPTGTVDPGNVLTYDATGLVPGTTYNLGITAKNANGYGSIRMTTLRVATWVPTSKPTLTVTRSGTTATLTYTAPANPGKATLTSWFVNRTGPGSTPADKTVTTNSTTMAGLLAGTQTFTVRPNYAADDTAGVQTSDPKSIVVTTKPSAPRIGTAVSGKAGGTRTATAKWAAPLSNGGVAITSYRVVAYKFVSGRVTRTYVSKTLVGSARSFVFALPRGSFKFRIIAYNSVGASPSSAYSKLVSAR